MNEELLELLVRIAHRHATNAEAAQIEELCPDIYPVKEEAPAPKKKSGK
jgi:hypothetical protein